MCGETRIPSDICVEKHDIRGNIYRHHYKHRLYIIYATRIQSSCSFKISSLCFCKSQAFRIRRKSLHLYSFHEFTPHNNFPILALSQPVHHIGDFRCHSDDYVFPLAHSLPTSHSDGYFVSTILSNRTLMQVYDLRAHQQISKVAYK